MQAPDRDGQTGQENSQRIKQAERADFSRLAKIYDVTDNIQNNSEDHIKKKEIPIFGPAGAAGENSVIF